MTESRRGERGGGGVRVLSYVSHIVMCRPKKVGLLRRFNLKTCIDFGHFDLESVMVFEEKEEICEFEVDLKKSLLTASYATLSHDDLRGQV